MRRADREVTGISDILAILDQCDIMRIGLSVDNKPYIVPLNFAYEVIEETVYIYFHCAAHGKKLDMIRQNPNICFEADCSYQLEKAKDACAWSNAYQSVMGEGKIEIMIDAQAKEKGLDILMKRYGFEGKPTYTPQSLEAVIVLRLYVETISGKRRPGRKAD